MKRWLFLIALGLGGGLALRQFLFEGIYVATPSMEPTLPVGAHYFVDKLSYFFREPKRGEIVIFPSPEGKGIDLIKRVIALPGDTLAIREKKVYLNGQPLEEPYTVYKRKDEILVGDNIPEMKIPEDCYFVMGDNRDESGDSRDWKDAQGKPIVFVKRSDLRGRLMDPLQ